MTTYADIQAADQAALQAAEAQGERVLSTLLPGDSFIWKGHHTIRRMQWRDERREMLLVSTTPTEEYPKGRTFTLNALLMFPAFLTDEHFADEQAKLKDW